MENNFNILKKTISKILFESNNTGNKELDAVWKTALNEIKASPILKTMFVVYNNIESSKFKDKDTAEIFLNENLFSFGSFSKEAIIKDTQKIYNILKEHISPTDSKDEVFELILESTKDRKLSRLAHKAELFNTLSNKLTVAENLMEAEVKQDNGVITDPAVINRAIEILNEKFSFLEDGEKEIVKAFVTKNETHKQEIFENLVKTNLKFIKRNLFENEGGDEELVGLLKESEQELLNMKYTPEVNVQDYVKLLEFTK